MDYRPTSKPGTLNLDDIQHLAPNSPKGERAAIAEAAELCFSSFAGLETRIQRASFLAQVCHETGQFRFLKELGDPEYLSLYEEGGLVYCGRGWMMTTWHYNYELVARRLDTDFVNHPEKLEQYPWAALSAGVFWEQNRCGEAIISDGFLKQSRIINGHTDSLPNGYNDRLHRFQLAREIYGIGDNNAGANERFRRDSGGGLRPPHAAAGGSRSGGFVGGGSRATPRLGADYGARLRETL